MNNAVQINEVYIANKKEMIPMMKGVLSLDSAAAIDAFRKAIEAEKKDLHQDNDNVISKTCKSK